MATRIALLSVLDQLAVSSRSLVFLAGLGFVSADHEFGGLALSLTLVQLCCGLYAASIVDQWLMGDQQAPMSPVVRALKWLAPLPMLGMLAAGDVLTKLTALVAVTSIWLLSVEELRIRSLRNGRGSTVLIADAVVPVGLCLALAVWPSSIGITVAFTALTACSWLVYFSASLCAVAGESQKLDARVGLALAGDYLTSVGYGQAIVVAVGYLLSPAEAGALRLVQSVFAIPGVAISGLRVVLLPRRRVANLSQSKYWTMTVALTGTTALFAAVMGVMVTYGASQSANLSPLVASLVVPLGVQACVVVAASLAPMLLKAAGLTLALLRTRLAVVTTSVGCVLCGAAIWGLEGVGWGLCLGSLSGMAAWTWQIRKYWDPRRESDPA